MRVRNNAATRILNQICHQTGTQPSDYDFGNSLAFIYFMSSSSPLVESCTNTYVALGSRVHRAIFAASMAQHAARTPYIVFVWNRL